MHRTRAPNSSEDHLHVDKDTGANVPGTAYIAEDQNCQQEELMHLVEDAGFSESLTDRYQIERSVRAFSKYVGETFTSMITLTPVSLSASRSTANPTFPSYAPIIPRHDADHDISTAQVPQWVIDELNAEKVTFSGISDFTATLAGGVLTFASTTENNKLVNWVSEQSLVARWFGSNEDVNFAGSGGLFTGTAQMSVTIGGVNYAIIGCSVGSRTITLASYPADGTVTVALYPGRIAGSTTSSRLRRISGEALVAAGDITGEVIVGGRRMDKGQEHIHYIPTHVTGDLRYGKVTTEPSGSTGQYSTITTQTTAIKTSTLKTGADGGTPRTGKTTDPRSAGMAVYTHLAVVNATNWT